MNQEGILCMKAMVDALISVAGMQAANQYRTNCGNQVAYVEQDFYNVQANLDAIFQLYIGHV